MLDIDPRAQPIQPMPRPDEVPDTYPKGRGCLEPGCITTLSIYNGGPWCWLHAGRHRDELEDHEDERQRRIAERPPRTDYVVQRRGSGATLQDIADELGLTRQRVHQIVRCVHPDALAA